MRTHAIRLLVSIALGGLLLGCGPDVIGTPPDIDETTSSATPHPDCDDENPCTDDLWADKDTECRHEPLPDGTQCSAFPVAVCNDGNCGL
jgi:hypothetical protein